MGDRRILLALLSLALATAGCGGRRTSSAGGAGENEGAWTLRETGVGQLELGMSEAELKEAAEGAEIAPANPAPEGLEAPVLEVRRGGKTVLWAEMKNGKARRFTTEDPSMMTSYGVMVGTPVAQLEQQGYGPGRVETVGDGAVARFDVAPTLTFVLPKSAKGKDWTSVTAANPEIRQIQIAEP